MRVESQQWTFVSPSFESLRKLFASPAAFTVILLTLLRMPRHLAHPRSIYRKNKNLFRKESLNERMRVIPAFRVTCSCLSGTATFVPIDFARVDGKFSVTGWHP